jgi:large subunit ribosomal protein L28
MDAQHVAIDRHHTLEVGRRQRLENPHGWDGIRLAASLLRSAGSCTQSLHEVFTMASVCEVCGKKPQFGMRLSHSHRRTKRRWNPNVQRVRAIVNGAPRRIHVCTSCLKAGKVQKP